jgi:GNAT superfamily N-acetyltransferase
MNIIIRPATQADMETLLQFEQGVIEAERPFDSTIKRSDAYYYDLEKMIAAKNVHLVVAEVDEEIIGCGYARIEKAKPFLQYAQYSYLGFMYVKPEYRGKGVNQKIVEVLKQWSLGKGITELRLQVYYDNMNAIKAYEKAGFKNLLIEMRMAVK